MTGSSDRLVSEGWQLGVVDEIKALLPEGHRVAFVSGNFNVLHPGHLRLLNFAADCADFLVVGVLQDNAGLSLLPEDLRLEAVRSIGIVNHAFVLRTPPEDFIRLLEPQFVVKGKEHQNRVNPELGAVEAYGGSLLFSSGDVRFSSLDLLQRELWETDFSTIRKCLEYPQRHGFEVRDLVSIVDRFADLNVVVVGDLIVDEYISCEPLGMSQEDPTIVVTPIMRDSFVGGAGIVAAHASSLGAATTYFCVTGDDETASFAASTLDRYAVDYRFLTDGSRPTTLKQRYRASGKTLLRVSHLRQHDIGDEVVDELFGMIEPALNEADLVVFSDFSYGCLPQRLVDAIIEYCSSNDTMMVADSQASSQIGDVSRFRGMRLVTPTEREARLSVGDFSSGLVVLAEALREKAEADQIIMTLGTEGVLIQVPNEASRNYLITDRLRAFNSAPKDVSGGGDSLLICASMALAVSDDIWKSAYLGSVAAACQVSRVGNSPLTAEELMKELLL